MPTPQTRRNHDDRNLYSRYTGPHQPQPRRPLPLPVHDFLVLAPHPMMLAENPPVPHATVPQFISQSFFSTD